MIEYKNTNKGLEVSGVIENSIRYCTVCNLKIGISKEECPQSPSCSWKYCPAPSRPTDISLLLVDEKGRYSLKEDVMLRECMKSDIPEGYSPAKL